MKLKMWKNKRVLIENLRVLIDSKPKNLFLEIIPPLLFVLHNQRGQYLSFRQVEFDYMFNQDYIVHITKFEYSKYFYERWIIN